MADIRKCKSRITKEIIGIFPEYQPKLGKTYIAEYRESSYTLANVPPICVVDILGKRIIVRQDEFELVEQ